MATSIQHTQLDGVALENTSGDGIRTQSGAIKSPLRSFHGRLMKRMMDICLSLPVVMFVLPPVAAVSWLTHRLQSPGSLLFRQERCGLGGKKFTILKIRTMDQVADSLAGNVEARIFPLGKILRKTKLDEVPQFINVLAGSMSVVGPRPHHFQDCENFESAFRDYAARKIAKPGITGLAQYKEYRGDFEWNCVENRVKRDLVYIREWSVLLDIKLIIKTANVIFQKSRRGVISRIGHRVRATPARLEIFDEHKPASVADPEFGPHPEINEKKAA